MAGTNPPYDDGDAGDKTSFRGEQHRTLILRFLRGRVRDLHVAEDLTQETLMRGLLYARGLRNPQAAGAWLLRIAFHVVTDWHRRASRRADRDLEADQIEVPHAGDDAPARARIDAEFLRESWRATLRRALKTLDRLDRTLVIGHYFVGFTCTELAKRSGLTRANVKVRLSRARRKLKAVLPAELKEALREAQAGRSRLPPVLVLRADARSAGDEPERTVPR